MSEDKTFLDIGKNIHSYDDAIKYFLPKNLAYLTGCENSMFYIKKLKKEKYKIKGTYLVPEYFSIIDNAKQSYDFLSSIIAAFLFQTCAHLELDYRNCKKVDLASQVFLDAILLDVNKFINLCKKARVYDKYIT